MKDTTKAIYEATLMEFEVENKNRRIYNEMAVAESNISMLMKYTPERVAMVKNPSDGAIYCEFANNIERYMKDNNISFQEAMRNISETYNIHECDINVIFTEMDTTKINMESIVEHYSFVKF